MSIELLTPFTKVNLERKKAVRKRRQVGILCGYFNPVHQGHLLVADQVRQQLCLDEVLLVPEQLTPQLKKENAVDEEDRLKMLQLAIEETPSLGLKKVKCQSNQTTYTYDLVKSMIDQHPETDYYLIIGADMVSTLSKWYRIDDLMKMVQFVGVQRPRYKTGTSYPLIWVDLPLMDISSTMIRDYIAKGRQPRFMLPQKVLDYIEEKGLYRK